MKLVLLGTGGYYPTERRQTACFMMPEIGVILDAGTGMYRLGDHLQTDRLDIFLTHAHLDHIAGLTYLINILPPRVLAQTTIHGEAEKLNAVREHLFAEAIFPVPPDFIFEPLHGSHPLHPSGTLTYFPLAHPGGAIGFRLDWSDRSLAYVTDTTATVDAPYVDAIRGVDLLLHEAYFTDDSQALATKTGHSALSAVAVLAAEVKPRRLVLVHLDPRKEIDAELQSARRLFPNIYVAKDNDQFEI
jgi:ribonuclease BN (tRNA processing enzyme)